MPEVKISREDLSAQIALDGLTRTATALGINTWLVKAACAKHDVPLPGSHHRAFNRSLDEARVARSNVECVAEIVCFAAVLREEKKRWAAEDRKQLRIWKAGAAERQRLKAEAELASAKKAEAAFTKRAEAAARYKERYPERVMQEIAAREQRQQARRDFEYNRLELVLKAASSHNTQSAAAQSMGISASLYRQLLSKAIRLFKRRHGQVIASQLLWSRQNGSRGHAEHQTYSENAATLERVCDLQFWSASAADVVEAMAGLEESLKDARKRIRLGSKT